MMCHDPPNGTTALLLWRNCEQGPQSEWRATKKTNVRRFILMHIKCFCSVLSENIICYCITIISKHASVDAH